jgi:DNA-binding beta-propeller fold protein YncE
MIGAVVPLKSRRCGCPLRLRIARWFVASLVLGGSLLAAEPWQPLFLPSGQVLRDPPAGEFLGDLNAFPINSAVSPDGRYVAFLNNGYGTAASGFRRSIAVLDRDTMQLADYVEPGTGLNFDGPANISTPYYGLAFGSARDRLYLSLASTKTNARLGDRTQNGIRIYRLRSDGLEPQGVIPITPADVSLPAGLTLNNPAPTPAGLAVRPDPDAPGEDLVYAALTLADAAVEISTKSRSVRRVFNLHTNPAHPALPAEYPYACAVGPDGRTLYVSLHNGSAVAAVDLATGAVSRLPVGIQPDAPSAPSSHPCHLAVHPSGKAVYVAVENSDQIAVIDNDPDSPHFRTVVDTLDVRPPELSSRNWWGASPNHLAFTPDGRRLLVSLGLLNAVAVVDLPAAGTTGERPVVAGYLPTLWYPHTLEISRDGQTVYLTSGKGRGTGSNKPNRPTVPGAKQGIYAPTLIKGSLHQLPLEGIDPKLAAFTESVRRNNQIDAASFQAARQALEFNPFRHVIYIIKENRTYDQLFGDLAESNADPACLYFGETITPNHHRLAREFGIYDNFYCSAEVSFSGHTWSTAGINSGWNEQQWQINYATGNFTYDSEGKNNDAFPIAHNQSDVDSPQGGYLWDSVLRAGKTLGMYGEYLDNPAKPLATIRQGDPLPAFLTDPRLGSASRFPWPIPLYGRLDQNGQVEGGAIPTKPAFQGACQTLFPTFEMLFPDVFRCLIWKRDFDRIARHRLESGEDTLPALSIVRFCNDHTRGVSPGGPSPDACVADNDLALGWLVEAVSSDPYYWGNTAIVVLEDDAQAGCDHVDSHRSPVLFISRYNRRPDNGPALDSRFLTTAGAVRTVEALLDLPAGNLMTATAPLLLRDLETDPARWHGPYAADMSNLNNGLLFQEAAGALRDAPKRHELVRLTRSLDLDEADEADAATFNYILDQWVVAQGRLKPAGGVGTGNGKQ